MDQADSVAVLKISGAPDKCSLKVVKTELLHHIEDRKAVSCIKRCKKPDGSIIPGMLDVELTSEKAAQSLLKQTVIELEYEDCLSQLRITRSRPKTKSNNEPHQSTQRQFADTDHPSESTKSIWGTLHSASEQISSEDENSDDQLQTLWSNPRSSTETGGSSLRNPSAVDKSKRSDKLNNWRTQDSNDEEDEDDRKQISSVDQKASKGTCNLPSVSSESETTESDADEIVWTNNQISNKQHQASSSSRQIPQLQEDPVTWFDLLQTDSCLFEQYKHNCVIIQNLEKEIEGREICAYFEDGSKSSGGKIHAMHRLQDGILIVFEDSRDAYNVAKKEHVFHETELIVYLKTIPSIYEDRMLIKGNFPTDENVRDVIDCCTDLPYKVKETPRPNQFMVLFEEPIDIDKLKSQVSKIPPKKPPKKVMKLCHPGCIKVDGIKKSTPDDHVRLAFCNKKVFEGEVTLVERIPQSKVALVYFANYKAAEKLVKKLKQQKFTIAKSSVVISLFSPEVDDSSSTVNENESDDEPISHNQPSFSEDQFHTSTKKILKRNPPTSSSSDQEDDSDESYWNAEHSFNRSQKIHSSEKRISKTPFSPRRLPELPENPVTWFEFLQTNPELFDQYNNNCILVQNMDEPVKSKQVYAYFENKATSGGGPIKTIARLRDGILVVFEKRKVACKVQEKHEIDENELVVYLKTIPSVYDDRIFIEGTFSSMDDVKNLLDACTDIPYKIRKIKHSDKFLVVFEEPLDMKELQKEIKKLRLMKMSTKVKRICRPDCIKVDQIKKEVTNQTIQLAFRNKKVYEGEVTLVERDPQSSVAFVYFASYEAAEKVVQKSKIQDIQIAKSPVVTSLFYPETNGPVEYSTNEIGQCQHELEHDPDIVRFLLKSKHHLTELYKEFGDLAQVEFVESYSDSLRFIAKFKALLSKEQIQEINQEDFEMDCKRRIKKFLKKFKTIQKEFPEEDQDRVRKDKGWQEEEEYIEIEIKSKDLVSVYIRWSNEERGSTKVSGTQKHVTAFADWFEAKCNFIEESEIFSEKDFLMLKDCGLIEDTKEHFEDLDVLIIVKENERQIVFEGNKQTVSQSMKALKGRLSRLQNKDLSFLREIQNKFLSSFAVESPSGEHFDVAEYIRGKLRDSHIKVLFLCEKERMRLWFHSRYSNELERAEEKIKSLVKMRDEKVENSLDDIIIDEEWITLKNKIEETGTLQIFANKRLSTVTLVGLPLSFDDEFDKISTFLRDNVEAETKVQLSYSHAMFVSEFPNEVGMENAMKQVEWFKTNGGINLKGKACLVKKATQWIHRVTETIMTTQKRLFSPGMSEYLRDRNGQQFLKTIEKENRCFIQLDNEKSNNWDEEPLKNSATSSHIEMPDEDWSFLPEQPPMPAQAAKSSWSSITAWAKDLLSNFFRPGSNKPQLSAEEESSVKVSVKHGDILQSDCEVIVNTTGDDFNLNSKLSRNLLEISGQLLATELDKNPAIKSNTYRVTSAPHLKFKNIIHLVSPDNAEDISTRLLEACLLAENKLNLTSLAVPAIGTGQIGLPENQVAKNIKKAIDAFKKTRPGCLKKVVVVVFEKRMVKAFTSALIGSKPFSLDKSSFNTSPNQASHSSTSSPPSLQSSSVSSRSKISVSSVSVVVQQGDILSSNCDVIVNTTGNDFDLTKSQLSKKVLQQGGSVIDTECQSKSSHHSSCYRVTSGGNLPCKNIVHFVTPYNNNPLLTQSLIEVFNLIDQKMNLNSVALPAIGAGNAGQNVSDVADAMGKAINLFLQKTPKCLKRIDVVIYDQAILREYKSRVVPTPKSTRASNVTTAPAKSKKVKEKLFPSISEDDEKHTVSLFLTSNSEEHINNAYTAVVAKANKKCAKKFLKDEVLDELDEEDLKDLMGIQREFNVYVKAVQTDSDSSKLEILGLKDNVNNAYTYAITLLNDYSKALKVAEYVQWEYQDSNNTWKPFLHMSNYKLENSYKENGSNGRLFLSSKIEGVKCQINADFSKLNMTNTNTGSVSNIRRSMSSSVDQYPSIWDSSKSLQLVPIDQTNYPREYQEIIQQFQQTRGNTQLNVVRLERVENKNLYTQFMAQKKEVQDRMTKTNVTEPVTRKLFHGTSHDVMEKIYKKGFNRSYAGKNATVYGKGVYFATTSEYSHRYTVPDANQERKMFLADVVTGEYCQGNQNIIDAPVKPNGTPADLYDSVVDNAATPSIFVVFKDASVYPLYILTFT